MYNIMDIKAWNEHEAECKFSNLYPDLTVAGVSEKITPITADGVTVEDHPVKGSRHWILRHYIYQCKEIKINKNLNGELEESYEGLKLVNRDIESKTEAVKEAKKLTLSTYRPHSVRIVKILDGNASNVVCDVLPKGGEAGTYTIVYTQLDPRYAIKLTNKVTLASAISIGFEDELGHILSEFKADWLSGKEGTVIGINPDGSYIVEVDGEHTCYTYGPSMLCNLEFEEEVI